MNEKFAFLTGQSKSGIVHHPTLSAPLHQEVIPALLQLQREALDQGMDLQVLSGHRDFWRQLLIWNEKAQGKRPILDETGQFQLPHDQLSPREKVLAILRWSALPGTSRHHWGTDMDVYDKAALTANVRVQLIPQETTPQGLFGRLHQWLDKKIATRTSYGFYRPYERDQGGVAPERWHLSYAPLAVPLAQQWTPELFYQFLTGLEIELKDALLQAHEEIYWRFVQSAQLPPFSLSP